VTSAFGLVSGATTLVTTEFGGWIMRLTIKKWGNGLGIRIPKPISERLGLCEGMRVEFVIAAGVLTIRLKRRRKFTLARLLATAAGPSPHRDLACGGRIGRELL
jgi:antitoxin component of MazEF toxin-antitoxin module